MVKGIHTEQIFTKYQNTCFANLPPEIFGNADRVGGSSQTGFRPRREDDDGESTGAKVRDAARKKTKETPAVNENSTDDSAATTVG